MIAFGGLDLILDQRGDRLLGYLPAWVRILLASVLQHWSQSRPQWNSGVVRSVEGLQWAASKAHLFRFVWAEAVVIDLTKGDQMQGLTLLCLLRLQ